MVRKDEYQQRNCSQGSFSNQGQRNTQEQGPKKENVQLRNFRRDNQPRHSYPNQNILPRHTNRVKAEETIEDIKIDISRIEKEIELEIKEIRSLRLGL